MKGLNSVLAAIAAWMFRYDTQPSSNPLIYFKHDRWTGTVVSCAPAMGSYQNPGCN
jgi:hypothetical protein